MRISLWLATCAVRAQAAIVAPYPEHWWAPVPESGKPAWEVLPQAAGPGEVVVSKRNELGILSNFAATPFVFRGKRYASVEGLWQMMLYPENDADPRARASGVTWVHTREQVSAMTAFEAKAAGALAEANMRAMGIDWVTFEGRRMAYRAPTEPGGKGDHYRLIVEAMREKLRQNAPVRTTLMATGSLKLKPDHLTERDAPPAWRYNEIWMEIRDELRTASR